MARENTLESFAAAVELGVDGVELDVRRTRDGVLVVHHDALVETMVIAETNAHDLPGFVPTLGASMRALHGVTVNVEIKNSRDPKEPTYDDTGAFARRVVEYLDEIGAIGSTIISCFDLATCERVRRANRDVRVAWLLWGVGVEEAATTARELGLHAINPHVGLVDEASVALSNDLGLAMNVWTVNETADLVRLYDLGVASVITDQPALALELFAGRSR